MAETNQASGGDARPNGAAAPEPKRSLREIAEAAYDDLTSDDTGAAEPQPGVDTPAQPRDERGRYAAKDTTAAAQPGEAAGDEPTQPREDQGQKPQDQHPAPAQPGEAAQAPANWSAEDRATFDKLPQEGKQFLLRRHSEMEGDYQRRVQAVRGAAEFAGALEPVFRDPVIAGSLQQSGVSPYDAILQWAGFHKRAMSPDVRERVQLAYELAARMGLDPAVFAPSRPGPAGPTPQLSEDDLKDPAIRYFADQIGRSHNEVAAMRAQLQAMERQAIERQNADAVRQSRWSIDAFADEKGPDGKPLRPDFDQVLDTVIELFRANPNRDLNEAYQTARWMNPTTRAQLIAGERAQVEQKAANTRAAQAVRSNVRGITSPVSKPAGDGKPQGLRAALEGAADEIGF